MNGEQKYIVETFHKSFSGMSDKRIVLYGIGMNTELILRCEKQIPITGLMDAQNEGKKRYGLKIYSQSEVMGIADMIVVIARSAVLPIIFKRIQDIDHKIPVYDIHGRRLRELYENEQDITANPYWNETSEHVHELMGECDVISFDIFDTLLMRKVPKPDMIFDIVSEICPKAEGSHYKAIRMRAEQSAKRHSIAPKIDDIYAEMSGHMGEPDFSEEMKKYELKAERSSICPRKEGVDLFFFALNTGKPVVLTSDMYWDPDTIEGFLKDNGIYGYTDIFISCEYGESKENGALFEVVKEKYPRKKIMHIGDDENADIQNAKEHGIKPVFLMKSYDMLLQTSLRDVLVPVKSFQDNLLIGKFMAEMLNSPFAFNEKKGKLVIGDERVLARWAFAPLICVYMSWLLKRLHGRKRESNAILFTSRDGYLIKRIYDQLVQSHRDEYPESIYFYTSRRAVMVANLRDETDIMRRIDYLQMQSSRFGEILFSIFGVEADRGDELQDMEVNVRKEHDRVKRYILGYKKKILKNAEEERVQYRKYIKGLAIDGKALYVFDLACEGTVAKGIETLTKKKNILTCFATFHIPNMHYENEDGIMSMFGNFFFYDLKYNFLKYFKLFEVLLAPDEPTFIRFDEKGNKVFGETVMGKENADGIKRMQDEIVRRMDEEGLEFWEGISRDVADALLGMIHPDRSAVSERIKGYFRYDDEKDGLKNASIWDSVVV